MVRGARKWREGEKQGLSWHSHGVESSLHPNLLLLTTTTKVVAVTTKKRTAIANESGEDGINAIRVSKKTMFVTVRPDRDD